MANTAARLSAANRRCTPVIEGWFPALTLLGSPLSTTLPRMNRVHIKTYGCQMNERDSEAVAAMLRARGYRIVASEDDCDVLLLNTCSVRDAAEQKEASSAAT